MTQHQNSPSSYKWNEMKLIKEYIFKDYPREVKLTNGQRPKYFLNDKKLPIRIAKKIGTLYDFEYKDFIVKGKKTKKQIIVDMHTRQPLYSNESKITEARTKNIRGQELHSLTLMPAHRSIIIETLKEYFIHNMVNQGIIVEKINNLYIELEFCTDERYLGTVFTDGLKDISVGDLDSHELFYKKSLFDCIQFEQKRKDQLGMIPNPCGFIPYDNVRYLNDYRIIFTNTRDTKNIKFRIYDKSRID